MRFTTTHFVALSSTTRLPLRRHGELMPRHFEVPDKGVLRNNNKKPRMHSNNSQEQSLPKMQILGTFSASLSSLTLLYSNIRAGKKEIVNFLNNENLKFNNWIWEDIFHEYRIQTKNPMRNNKQIMCVCAGNWMGNWQAGFVCLKSEQKKIYPILMSFSWRRITRTPPTPTRIFKHCQVSVVRLRIKKGKIRGSAWWYKWLNVLPPPPITDSGKKFFLKWNCFVPFHLRNKSG